MTPDPPTFDLLTPYRPLARVPPHRGTASLRLGEGVFSGAAEFLLPAGSQAIIAFHAPADLTSQDFGRDLIIEGAAESGVFRIECARVYVRKPSGSGEGSFWSLISPVNGPARIRYGDDRLVRRAVASVLREITPVQSPSDFQRAPSDRKRLRRVQRVILPKRSSPYNPATIGPHSRTRSASMKMSPSLRLRRGRRLLRANLPIYERHRPLA